MPLFTLVPRMEISANFALTEFSEVRLYGVLGSSAKKLRLLLVHPADAPSRRGPCPRGTSARFGAGKKIVNLNYARASHS
jgi:hypothetical protein